MAFIADIVFDGYDHSGQLACFAILDFGIHLSRLFQGRLSKYFQKGIQVLLLSNTDNELLD
jgi:hypothetical protein